MPLVPPEFEIPRGLRTSRFRLEPLGPEHHAADFAAWSSSVEHIRGTPGFEAGPWPREMGLAENLADLERHARDFAERVGFTYTVLDEASGEVIGCVYLDPDEAGPHDVLVRSWVCADRADLDEPLRRAVREWLEAAWPFRLVSYAEGRSAPSHD